MDIEAIQRSIVTASRVQHEYYKKLLDILSQINLSITEKNFAAFEWFPLFTAYPPGGPKSLNFNKWALDFLPMNNFRLQWQKGPDNQEGFCSVQVLHLVDSGVNQAIKTPGEILPANFTPIEESFTYLKIYITTFDKGAKPLPAETWALSWEDVYKKIYEFKPGQFVAFESGQWAFNKIQTTAKVHKLSDFADLASLKAIILDKLTKELG